MKNLPDAEALKILLDYDLLAPDLTSKQDFEYAKKAGLMFDAETQSHDMAVALAHREATAASKKHVVNAFIASFSSNRLEWRSGLAAYAIMQSFPTHAFEPVSPENTYTCAVCCGKPSDLVNRSFYNRVRFTDGGLVGYSVYELAFDLQQHNLLPLAEPTPEDFAIFSAILTVLSEAEAEATPTKVQKQLRLVKGFKSTEEQRRTLMTTLGYCGVLETDKHRGFLHAFANMCKVPRKSRNTDWRYPIDWWMGRDKLNKDNFKFWFGAYPQLANYWE